MKKTFTRELPDFLWDLRFNNNAQWFNEHREVYQSCLQQPMKSLATEMTSYMDEKYKTHVFKLHISRINRDLRRPSPFGPYKDHMWFSIFNAFAPEYDRPSLYFSVHPEGWSAGCGIFKAPQTVMMKYRETIITAPEKIRPFAKKIQSDGMFMLCGEDYKKSKGDAGALLTPWLNKKELYVATGEMDYNELFFSEELSDFLKDAFDRLMPYYEFLERICDEVHADE